MPRAFLVVLFTLLVAVAVGLSHALTSCCRVDEGFEEAIIAPTEPSTNVVASTRVSDINSVFQQLYTRDASTAELAFWTTYITSHGLVSRDQLFDVVSYSSNTVLADSHLYGTENLVILTFNNVLDRNPNRLELRQYASLLRQTAGTDKMSSNDEAVLKLTRVLLGSSEFIRMEKTQQNKVFSTLPGDLTDRQLTMAVTSIYTQFPNAPPMDEDTMKFLKRKLIAFNLDPVRLKAFVDQYMSDVSVDDVGTGPGADAITAANVQSIIDLNLQSDDVVVAGDPSVTESRAVDAQVSVAETDVPITFTDLSPSDLTMPPPRMSLDPETGPRSPSRYVNASDDMVLYPEFKWMVPILQTQVANATPGCAPQPTMGQSSLIGTLLPDSFATQIGSITPFYPPT